MLFEAQACCGLLAGFGRANAAQAAGGIDQSATTATTNRGLETAMLVVGFIRRRIIGTTAQGDRADAAAADVQHRCDFPLRKFLAREQTTGFLDNGWRQHGKRSLARLLIDVLFPIAFVPQFLRWIGFVGFLEIVELVEVIVDGLGGRIDRRRRNRDRSLSKLLPSKASDRLRQAKAPQQVA